MIDRVINKLKRISNDFIFNTGNFSPLRLRNTKNTILIYHGTPGVGNTRFNSRHTSRQDFKAHVAFLKKYCHVITLQRFFEGDFIPGKPNIALTFDDGYRNNFIHAKPILEEAGVPGTFFITGLNETESDILWPDFLNIASVLSEENVKIDGEEFSKKNGVYHSVQSGESIYSIIKEKKAGWDFKQDMIGAFSAIAGFKKDEAFDEYWKLMTDDEIRACADSEFIEIGSHGFFHNNLGTISLTDARSELMKSKTYLENLIQKPVISLGYPDGSYSREVIDAAEKVGFKYQSAVSYLFDADVNDPRILDRKGVYSCDSTGNDLLANL
ncbi:MAG: polysaccharide deacetylase family protein [Bacteroidia bacterium]